MPSPYGPFSLTSLFNRTGSAQRLIIEPIEARRRRLRRFADRKHRDENARKAARHLRREQMGLSRSQHKSVTPVLPNGEIEPFRPGFDLQDDRARRAFLHELRSQGADGPPNS